MNDTSTTVVHCNVNINFEIANLVECKTTNLIRTREEIWFSELQTPSTTTRRPNLSDVQELFDKRRPGIGTLKGIDVSFSSRKFKIFCKNPLPSPVSTFVHSQCHFSDYDGVKCGPARSDVPSRLVAPRRTLTSWPVRCAEVSRVRRVRSRFGVPETGWTVMFLYRR